MQNETREFHIDADNARLGLAGMHDVVDGENINRILKQREVLAQYQSIYLPRPEHYVPGKLKMLLVQGPHDERAGTALFPLGLGYIARVLTDIGVAVEVVDAHAEGLGPHETLERIARAEFDLLGITALSTQYGFVKWLAAEVKKARPAISIVLGGQLAHYNPRTVIEHSDIDICVLGEGEVTIQEIIYNCSSGDMSHVRGVAFRDRDGRYRINPDRPRIFNVDAIPFPYWDAFNMDYYFTTGFFGGRARRAINVLSSRGCPYSCTFCSLSFPNVTYRSVDNVIEEIKLLQSRYGVNGIMFADELFVIDKKRVYEFCEKLKPLRISWGGQGRANIVNDDERLLMAMKQAGATYIGFGLESATSDMLSRMQKKTTVRQNVNCVQAAQKVGLIVVAQYMFGFPGETLETIKAGVEYFKETHYCPPLGAKAKCHVSLTTPLPGSQLYEDCKKSGFIADEDEYLTRISRGYFHNEEVIVNLTSFSNEELLDLKYAMQEIMTNNHQEWLKSQGWRFALSQAFQAIREMCRVRGVGLTSRQVVGQVRRILARALRGELRALSLWRIVFPEGMIKTDYVYRTQRSKEFRRILRA